jgi:hypothetical protein
MNTQNFIHIQLAAVGQLIALQMNVTTRHIEPQTSQYAAARKIFPGRLKQKYLEFTQHGMKQIIQPIR